MADELDGSSDRTDPEVDRTGGDEGAAAYPVADEPPEGSGRSRATWFAAVTALVVVALVGGAALVADDGDDGPPVLSVTPGGGFEAVGSALSDAGVSASSMSADIEYVLDGDLPDLGDTGTAYRLVRPDLSDDDVIRLAAALGADGTIQRADGTRVVSDDDRSVGVTEADGAWYVSSYKGGSEPEYATATTTAEAPASTVVTTPNGVPVEGSSNGAPVPVPTPPVTEPVDLPSEAEAEDIARGVLDAAGVEGEWSAEVSDGSAMAFACASDGPCADMSTTVLSRSVSLELVVDGLATGIAWYVEVADRGDVTSVSGTITELEEVGDYPLRPTRDVYDDLVAGDVWYGGPPVGYAAGGAEQFTTVGSAVSSDSGAGEVSVEEGCTPEECGVVDTVVPLPPDAVLECTAPDADGCGDVSVCQEPESPPTTDPTTSTKFCSVGEEPVPDPGTDPQPTPTPAPLPEPEPMPALVVHVTGAERSLVQAPGVSDGEAVTWLLPAYRFTGTWEIGERWYADLPAIDDAYIDLPAPAEPATTVPDVGAPDDPATSTTTPSSTDGTPPPASVADPSTTTTGPAAPDPTSSESEQPPTGPTTTSVGG